MTEQAEEALADPQPQEVVPVPPAYYIPRYFCTCGAEFPPNYGHTVRIMEDSAILMCGACGREHKVVRPIVQL